MWGFRRVRPRDLERASRQRSRGFSARSAGRVGAWDSPRGVARPGACAEATDCCVLGLCGCRNSACPRTPVARRCRGRLDAASTWHAGKGGRRTGHGCGATRRAAESGSRASCGAWGRIAGRSGSEPGAPLATEPARGAEIRIRVVHRFCHRAERAVGVDARRSPGCCFGFREVAIVGSERRRWAGECMPLRYCFGNNSFINNGLRLS